MLEGFDYLHTCDTTGYTHGDVKDDNLVVGRVGRSYEIKIMDFGLMVKLNEDHKVNKVQVRLGSNGAVPEATGTGMVDGRRVDMHRLGAVLFRMTPPQKSAPLQQLIDRLMNCEPSFRPLAGELLDPVKGGDWLWHNGSEHPDTATEVELIDELESRMSSADLLTGGQAHVHAHTCGHVYLE